MPVITLPANGWRPRSYQLPLWKYLKAGGKRASVIAHRRWGKDEIALNHAACAVFERIGNYGHCLPEYAQARKTIWTSVNPQTGKRRIDEAFPLELRENTNDQEMFIRFKNGSTWQALGSDQYDRLVGSAYAGMTFSEWALANPAVWGYVQPILNENNGWAVFITTPRGMNHAKSLHDMATTQEGWYCEISPASKTGALTRELLDNAKIELIGLYGKDVGEAMYEQEYECSFSAPILGAVYAKYVKQEQIIDFDYDPDIPVFTSWDLGFDDATAIIWYQLARNEIRVIDYYESNFEDPIHYCSQLYGREIIVKDRDLRTGKVKQWELGQVINERRDTYNYKGSKHYVPHDAANKLLQAGGRSFLEQCKELGVNMHVIPACGQLDSETALRSALPRCYFKTDTTKDLVNALMSYHYEYDDERKIYSKTPLHDWSSHASDSAEIMARAWRDESMTMRELDRREVNATFNRNRRLNNLDNLDPYRMKKTYRHKG